MSGKAMFLRREVPFYYQNRAHGTCGPLSICMVVDSFRGSNSAGVSFTDYEYLIRKLMGSDIKAGVPNHKITSGLDYFNMTYELIEGDTGAKLRKIREAIREDCPVILSVYDSFAGRRRGHYVVVVGFDDEHLYIHDPYLRGEKPNERKKINLARFCKQNSRTSMVWGRRRWALKVTGMAPEKA